ncbi:hypothetical protein ACFC0S_15695 [Streptomyces sp. NPDC056084]|uniref:hypothetical protein n=1 Tax=unclassified Streptomyces TaxID=2593676 RepID=UPI0035DD9482
MTVPTRARAAVGQFTATLKAASTRRQRSALLDEYLAWTAATRQYGTHQVATEDLLDQANAIAWLTAARRGDTRRRPGLEGPTARASANSMAARTSSVNTFSRWCGHPLELTPPPPEFADRLTPREAHRTLRILSGDPPAGMLQATWERTVAVIALAIATGHGMSALHPLRLADLDLERRPLPHVRVGSQWYPIIDAVSRDALTRWTATHQALTAGHLKVLRGGDVEELWVTTAPGRPRGGQVAPPAGLPAAIRTLEASHRKLTALALGSPLLLEQFCAVEDDEAQPRSTRTALSPGAAPVGGAPGPTGQTEA